MFSRLVVKIAYFEDIRQNNSGFTQKKKAHFNIINCEESRILLIFNKLAVYLTKNRAFKLNQTQEKINNSNS